jgi:glycosyltransferase involved in cell wall biosynthesis
VIASDVAVNLNYSEPLEMLELDAPLVSVIMPAYNVAPYIEAAISSVLAQTYPRFELLVVNDGSTDETQKVVQRVTEHSGDSRIRSLEQSNRGLAATRNTGLRAARGSLLAFLDSDDTWHPRKLELQVAALRSREDAGFCFCFSSYMHDSGALTGTSMRASVLEPTLHEMIKRNHCGNGSTVLARRQCFEIAGEFRDDLHSCEDYEMWCRILGLSDYRLFCVPESLTFYRLRATSLSFNSDKFVSNADRAMIHLRTALPMVPASVLRAGHAEHYRIAAWKAAMTGGDRKAWRLLRRAFGLSPLRQLKDFRTLATVGALLFPSSIRPSLSVALKSAVETLHA